MKLHGNAALSWRGRRCLVERVVVGGWTLRAAAEAAGVSVRCARKWVGRYRLEGELGLLDRSSAPRRVANRTAPERLEAIAKLRRLRITAAEIAETLEMPLSTVSGILTRSGMGRLGPARTRAGGPLRALTTRRAGPPRREEARPDPRPGHRVTGSRPAVASRRAPQNRLGIRPCRVDVECPRFRRQRVVRQLLVVPRSFSRSRPERGSRAWSAV